MVFSSVIFLHYFLPLSLLAGGSAQLALGTRAANCALLVLSLVFYAWGLGAASLWLLGASIAANYVLAISMERARIDDDEDQIRRINLTAIVFNLGLLVYFKYSNFLVGQASEIRILFGLSPWTWENVALPIGISFFTFHALSYIWDIKAGRCDALHNPIDLALYICLFPQLIAGPIIRYHAIDKQIAERSIKITDLAEGSLRFLHGLAKKVILADPAGAIADQCFHAVGADMTSAVAWLGAIAYTVQIYFDFSGYSDMAIGLGRMFGFRFPENFDRPYAAKSITEFWRRWHMTLSSWFRDYVYIPLGGSRTSETRTYANLLIVFVLTGFWHGANWTFLIWGLYHGALLATERLMGLRNVGDQHSGANEAWWARTSRRALVLTLVVIGWVLFRSTTLSDAWRVIGSLWPDFQSIPASVLEKFAPDDLVLLGIGTMLCLLPAHFKGPGLYHSSNRALRLGSMAALLMVALPIAIIRIASSSFSPFLYFQF